MADAKTSVGVWGTGSVGLRHLEVFRSIGAEVHAIPTRPERRASLESAGWRVADSFEAAMARGVRAFVVATNTARHADDAARALEAGCDVLIEKPLAVDLASARRILAASAKDAIAAVGCNLRFTRGLTCFREQLARVGRVHAVDVECRSYLPDWRPSTDHRASYSARGEEGGVIRDLIHDIDYTTWCFGQPTAVIATLDNLRMLGISSEEIATLAWRSPAGAHVNIRLDYLTRPARRRMTAFGAEGTLEWDAIAQTVVFTASAGARESWDVTEPRNAAYERQALDFISGVTGRTRSSQAAGLLDGAAALAVCDAARSSSASGCTHSVDSL